MRCHESKPAHAGDSRAQNPFHSGHSPHEQNCQNHRIVGSQGLSTSIFSEVLDKRGRGGIVPNRFQELRRLRPLV